MAVIKLEQVQSSRRQKLGGLANELYQSKLRNNPPVLPNRVVTIDKINTNSIQISWEKATDKETAQNKLKYKVQWVMGPSYSNNEAKETVYMMNVNSYKITGLYPNTDYRIQIIVNDGVRTSMYNALYVTTLPNEVDKERRDEQPSTPVWQAYLIGLPI